MIATRNERNMIHRQQKQSSSTFLRSNSSRGNKISPVNVSTSNSASLNVHPVPLSFTLSRRCYNQRSRLSTTSTWTSSTISRCSTISGAATASSSSPTSSLTSPLSSPSFSSTSSSYSSSSSTSSSSSSCPVLLSVLAWSVTLLLISSCLGIADAGVLMGHPLGKRSFMQLQCKGIYDKSIFARLDRICEDCYNLFREPQLHTLCRKNCFTSDYFKGCLDVLLLQDEMTQIQKWIKQLHGAEPGV